MRLTFDLLDGLLRAPAPRLKHGPGRRLLARRQVRCQCQGKWLIAVRVFFQWLTRQHYLMLNPASELVDSGNVQSRFKAAAAR